jgi:hypothetical protein
MSAAQFEPRALLRAPGRRRVRYDKCRNLLIIKLSHLPFPKAPVPTWA